MVETLPLWAAGLESLHRKVDRRVARLEKRSAAQCAEQFGDVTLDGVQRLPNPEMICLGKTRTPMWWSA